MRLSLIQLADLTGRDRHTIRKSLESLPPIPGKHRAHLYESSEALPLIYAVGNLEQARAKHALSQASLNAVREEELRKERIPREEVLDVVDIMLQTFTSTLKATNGQPLTPKKINELQAKIRRSADKLK
jgi:hypothetical protein